jgi:hypothetical protein
VLTFDKSVTFLLVNRPLRETEFGSDKPRHSEDGRALYSYLVMAIGAGRPQLIKVRVPGDPAAVAEGQAIAFKDLTGRLYQGREDNGQTAQRISFSATGAGRAS